MDVSDLVGRLLRRWAAVLVVVVLAVVAGLIGWTRTPDHRQVEAAVVIVPPKVGSDAAGQNPLLNLDNNLAQLATVLASALQSPAVAHALDESGARGSFTVSTVTGTNPSFAQLSPQLQFTVTADTAAQAVFATRSLVAQARVQLAALQDRAGVGATARATLVESAVPADATVVSGSRLRVAGSLALGVLVLGLLAVLVVDAVLRRRRTAPPAVEHEHGTDHDHDVDHDASDDHVDHVDHDDHSDRDDRDTAAAGALVDARSADDDEPVAPPPARKRAARKGAVQQPAAKRVGQSAKRVGSSGARADSPAARAGR